MSRLRLVMLPGLDGTGRLFEPVVPEFARDFDVEAVTYPPDRPELGYPEIVGRVREDLPREEPFILLGESFSGPVAAMLAAERPAGLRGLVMVVTFPHRPVRFHGVARAISRVLRLGRDGGGGDRPLRRLNVLDAVFGRLGQRLVEPILLGSTPDSTARAALRKASMEVRPEVLARRAAATLTVDVRDAFSRIDVPILILQAAQDRLIRPEAAAEMLALKPQADRIRIDGPHVLLASRPQECAEAIGEWAAQRLTQ